MAKKQTRRYLANAKQIMHWGTRDNAIHKQTNMETSRTVKEFYLADFAPNIANMF